MIVMCSPYAQQMCGSQDHASHPPSRSERGDFVASLALFKFQLAAVSMRAGGVGAGGVTAGFTVNVTGAVVDDGALKLSPE